MKESPVIKIQALFRRFIQLNYTGGIVLFIATLTAIIWANSSWGGMYHHLWEQHVIVGIGKQVLDKPLHIWINDGLMAIFFFVIGLELKREFMEGELSTVRKAALPVMAAAGGMIFPALIYYLINKDTAAVNGWGIPMATDIAFALGLLALAGKLVPPSLKVFLSALAVADDLGAVLVIALFYTARVDFVALGIAGIFLGVLVAGNLAGVRSSGFYWVLGIFVWIGFLLSGVHATIAGVLVAFTIPAATRISGTAYSERLRKLSFRFQEVQPGKGALITPAQHHIIDEVQMLSLAAETPLQKMEHVLHPWITIVIMPLFALANAGILIGSDFFTVFLNPVSIGVTTGLIAGKFTGILLFTLFMVKSGLSGLPAGATWSHITGVSLLAGVGFTMSLFVSGLAFNDPLLIEQAKYGILVASVIAGVSGTLLLKYTSKKTAGS